MALSFWPRCRSWRLRSSCSRNRGKLAFPARGARLAPVSAFSHADSPVSASLRRDRDKAGGEGGPGTTSTGIEPPRRPAFVTTHWSIVLAAARSDTTRAHDALAKLCQTYWPPLYAYVRRRGYSPEDAQDLTQGFFAHLLEHNAMSSASRDKGRFRSFLLASLNHFLSDEWDKARAQKRGAGKVISLDTQSAETWLGQQPSANLTPEQAFELRWAITLLEHVYQRLEAEHRQQGRAALFDALRTTLAGPGNSAPYAELGGRLGLNEGAVKVAVHRLRQRYRVLLRETIAETVASEAEVEEELRYLLRIVAGG
jgi:RNA polymerase sigma factor (sigma-70 family)